jgi:hypothetical protein
VVIGQLAVTSIGTTSPLLTSRTVTTTQSRTSQLAGNPTNAVWKNVVSKLEMQNEGAAEAAALSHSKVSECQLVAPNGVFHIACHVMRGAFRLLQLAFRLQLRITRQFAFTLSAAPFTCSRSITELLLLKWDHNNV